MTPEQLRALQQYYQQYYSGNNMLENAYLNATLSNPNDMVNPFPNISRNVLTAPQTIPTTPTSTNIPQAVLNEPVSDWENDIMTYQGKRYAVQNGQWIEHDKPVTGVAPWDGQEEESQNTFDWNNYAPFLNPYGTNMQTDFYNLGRFIGMEPGTQGRGLGIASAGLSSLLGGARTALSGYATSVATTRTQQEAREKMMRRNYTPQTQYRNNDYLGNL